MIRLSLTECVRIIHAINADPDVSTHVYADMLDELRVYALRAGVGYIDIHGMVNPTSPFCICITAHLQKGAEREHK